MNLNFYKTYRYYIFILIILALKLFLMNSFSSDYQNKLFINFTKDFISNIQNNWNTYETYSKLGKMDYFPYPPLMLIIQSVPIVIIKIFQPISLSVESFIFKMPSLIFDFIGMTYLMKLFPLKRKYIGVLYFASPIIMYAVYMHGQLDLIPTSILIIAIWHLVGRNNYTSASVFLALALLTKLHILLVVPIFFSYIFKRENLKIAVKNLFITFLITLCGMIPFISEGYYNMVLFNQKQSVLLQSFYKIGEIKIYLPLILILLVYLLINSLSTINKDLLISFCAISFELILVLVEPMPGWYVWMVPFFTVFFITVQSKKYMNLIIYLLTNIFYLVYFVIFHDTEYNDLIYQGLILDVFKIDNLDLRNIIYTIFIALSIYLIYMLYRWGILSNSLYKRKDIPFTIGISGDSGTGKTSLVSTIQKCFNLNSFMYLEGDGDHKWERGGEMWKYFTHLNPKANYIYKQAMDMKELRSGYKISRVDYDHSTGKFTDKYKISPSKYIVMCGLHALYLPQMRENLDLKIFMEPEETIRRYWKVQRDIKKRGYTKELITRQIESRAVDYKRYILPQKQYADIVISYFDPDLKDYFEEEHQLNLSLKVTIGVEIDLEPLIDALEVFGIKMQYDFSEDLYHQVIVFDGNSIKDKAVYFEGIIDSLIPNASDLFIVPIKYSNNLEGIIQILILMLISNKMKM